MAGTSIALFTAVPIVPALAATVNYGTLTILLTPAFLLVALRVYKSRSIRSSSLLALLVLGCFASLTKYTFLLMFVGVFIVLVVALVVGRFRRSITVEPQCRSAAFWLWGS